MVRLNTLRRALLSMSVSWKRLLPVASCISTVPGASVAVAWGRRAAGVLEVLEDPSELCSAGDPHDASSLLSIMTFTTGVGGGTQQMFH
jgi:hypothetical protein